MSEVPEADNPTNSEEVVHVEPAPVVRPIVTSDLSNEKLFSDFERKNFAAVFQKAPSVAARRSSLLISSFLAFFVLLLAAYYSSKVLIYKYDYINSDQFTIVDTSNTGPVNTFTSVTDPNVVGTFPSDDDYASKSVIVFDLTANRPIYTKNADLKTSIASLTKLASIQLLMKTVDLDQQTEISEEVETYNGAAIHFKKGEKYTNLDLIKAAVIASSNQAAYALNNTDDTVTRMNELAEVLQLQTTHFSNPAGFDDDGNYSTALEYVQIAKLFFQNKILKDFASKPSDVITEINENKQVRISNTNDLIRLGTKYVVSGKTGTTPKAGQNLLLILDKNGRQYMVILLNGIDRYKDAYKVIDRLP